MAVGAPPSHSKTRFILTLLCGCAFMTGIAGIAERMFPGLPREIFLVAAIIGAVAGVISAFLDLQTATVHMPVTAMSKPTSASSLSSGWLAATVIFLVVSLALPPLFL